MPCLLAVTQAKRRAASRFIAMGMGSYYNGRMDFLGAGAFGERRKALSGWAGTGEEAGPMLRLAGALACYCTTLPAWALRSAAMGKPAFFSSARASWLAMDRR